MKRQFIFLGIVAILCTLALAFVTAAGAAPATNTCYRESCDGTFAHQISNGGRVLLDESLTLVDASSVDVGSLRLYHNLNSKALHGSVHENAQGLAANLTFAVTITQTDADAGADTFRFSTQTACGSPLSSAGFCDTPQIGTDGPLADCFVVSLVWSENGVSQSDAALPQKCVTG